MFFCSNLTTLVHRFDILTDMIISQKFNAMQRCLESSSSCVGAKRLIHLPWLGGTQHGSFSARIAESVLAEKSEVLLLERMVFNVFCAPAGGLYLLGDRFIIAGRCFS